LAISTSERFAKSRVNIGYPIQPKRTALEFVSLVNVLFVNFSTDIYLPIQVKSIPWMTKLWENIWE